jgi:hypothetical protein
VHRLVETQAELVTGRAGCRDRLAHVRRPRHLSRAALPRA